MIAWSLLRRRNRTKLDDYCFPHSRRGGPCRAIIFIVGRPRVRCGTKPVSNTRGSRPHIGTPCYSLIACASTRSGAVPLVVLPSAVPMLLEPASPPDGRAEYEPLLLHGVVRP